MAGVPVTLTDDAGRVRFEGRQVGGGGSQPLADVLATGNDAGDQSIVNCPALSPGVDDPNLSLGSAPSVATGLHGGYVKIEGGTADDGGTPAAVTVRGASPLGPPPGSDGYVQIDGAQVYVNNNDIGMFSQAAFVANGSTVDQLRDALIAAGLMAAS